MTLNRILKGLCAALALLLATPLLAAAAPIPLASANTSVFAFLADDSIVSDVDPGSSTGALIQNNSSLSGAYGSGQSFALSDLSTGTLRASMTVTSTGEADTALVATGAARFGDAFTTFGTDGVTPFAWQPGSVAKFTLDVSGLITGNLDFAGSYVSLWIYEKGKLETTSLTATGLIGDVHIWTLGPQSQTFSVPGTPVITNYPTIPSQITYNFTPGQDFDWLLVLQASGGLFGNGGPNTFSANFANTVSVTYTGPTGSVTTSELFANFGSEQTPAPVPEPASLLLLSTGLGAVSLRRRLRRC